MSIFDCPIARCELMRTFVVTDQTQGQCAHENGCPPGIDCPLANCFSGREWVDEVSAGGAAVADGKIVAPHKTRRSATGVRKIRLAA